MTRSFIITSLLVSLLVAGFHRYAWPFRAPVDNIYYFSSDEAMADFNQVFENCYIYNNPDDEIADMCKDLEWFYHAKMAKLPEEEEVALHEEELLYAEESSEDGMSDDDLS